MSITIGSKFQVDPGSWEELAVEIFIGIYHGARHSVYITTKWLTDSFLAPAVRVVNGTTSNNIGSTDTKNDTTKSLKVFGVGFSRTGTVRFIYASLGFVLLKNKQSSILLTHFVAFKTVVANFFFFPSTLSFLFVLDLLHDATP